MMLRNFCVSLVPITQRTLNLTICFATFFSFYPVFVILNYIFGRWDSGELWYSIPGFGRFQEYLFPFSAWTGLVVNVLTAEIKIANGVDLWVEEKHFTKDALEKFHNDIPKYCQCWTSCRRRFLFLGSIFWDAENQTKETLDVEASTLIDSQTESEAEELETQESLSRSTE